MNNQKKFIVSHAPFIHDGSRITERSYHTMLAALPAVVWGILQYGGPAIGVLALSISSAMLWEVALNRISKQDITIGDGNAALIGMLLGMLLPAITPWWLILTGTFIAILIGKYIYGGMGGNPFNPVVVALAMLMMSWPALLDFDAALKHYDFGYKMAYPLTQAKFFGASSLDAYNVIDLLMGKQVGGVGATFGAGLIIGGLYLIMRGFIRWEISLSFIAGIFVTALLFYQADPTKYAGPFFHLFTGYTLIGAFFLATEDSSSPVNFIPMLLYGAGVGVLTILIRNIGAYVDGVILAILIMNVTNPLLDKIRPKAIGKVA